MANFLQVLPLAVVMVAGPQIISAFILATSAKARTNLVVYVVGAAIGSVLVTSIFYVVTRAIGAESASTSSSGSTTIDWVLIVVLVAAGVYVFRGRHTRGMPKWMSGLMEATPRFCFLLGLALLAIFPSDLITNFAVGSFLASHGSPLYHALGFWALTSFFLAIPLLGLLALGARADSVLPRIRTWIEANSWMVSLGVIVFFIAMEANDILSA